METLAVGERKVFTDVTLEVVPSKCGDCIGCWFYYKPDFCFNHPRHSIMGNCSWVSRTDGIDVIFKAVKEKED